MARLLWALIFIALIVGIAQQPAVACTDYAKAYCLLDTGLPVSSGVYDPCDYWLTWDYEFNRNSNQSNFTIIAFQVIGAPNTYRSYDSRYIYPGSYHYSGDVYVGPATENEVRITRQTGTGGHFDTLLGQAFYNNSNPTRPEGP